MLKLISPLAIIHVLLVGKCLAIDSPTWPPVEEICSLMDTLDGELLLPGNPKYDELRIMENRRFTTTPGMIILAQNEGDIRQALSLAIKYHLQPTVSSSGHDYVGRSTANNSIHIDLSAMNAITFIKDDPDSDTGSSAIMETGNNWGRVYFELDKVDKLMVGGTSPSVALGGYLLGGGHGPLVRSYGMAADSVMGIKMITIDNRLIYVDSEGIHSIDPPSETVDPDPELFWALRGGGGGTYGIVTSFRVKLHQPPPEYTRVQLYTPMHHPECGNNTGTDAMRFVNQWLDKHFENNKLHAALKYDSYDSGNFLLNGLYFGPFEEAWPLFQSVYNYSSECVEVNITTYSSFFTYMETEPGADTGFSSYIASRIMPRDTLTDEAFVKTFTQDIFDYDINIECVCVRVGGQAGNFPENMTSFNPLFRSGECILICGTRWDSEHEADYHIAQMRKFTDQFYKHGDGIYFNEPDYFVDDYFVDDWKTQFWGSVERYDRLLAVKDKWDPDSVLWCHTCVGSDRKDPPQNTAPSGEKIIHEMCAGAKMPKLQYIFIFLEIILLLSY